MKKRMILILILILIFIISPVFAFEITECNDKVDNDNDGMIDWGYTEKSDQECDSIFDAREGDYPYDNINWTEFPEFNLPSKFVLVFMAMNAKNNVTALAPLDHGFTHLGQRGTNEYGKDIQLPKSREVLWTGIAFPCRSQSFCAPVNPQYSLQPWENIYSPWNNNLTIYKEFWNTRLKWYANDYNDSIGKSLPNIDLIIPDIEKRLYDDDNPLDNEEILKIKGSFLIPNNINSLTNDKFVDSYKREMAKLYYEPINQLLLLGYKGKISYYGIDSVPITRTKNGIDDFSWEDWTSNWSLVNYIIKNFSRSDDIRFYTEFGPIFYKQDYLSPSTYIITPDYPISTGGLNGRGKLNYNSNPEQWKEAGKYLGYQLFQLEVNLAWSENYNKSILLWQWMEFHPGVWIDPTTSTGKFSNLSLRFHMAHSIAIFTFIDGGKGVFLFGLNKTGTIHRKVHHHYIYGIYRLSQYNRFFDGNYEIYRPETAHANFVNNTPIWRGVIKNNEMLVAAHNPFAKPEDKTIFNITYNNLKIDNITVYGLNTWLGICILNKGICRGDEGNLIHNFIKYNKFRNIGKTTNLDNLSYNQLQNVLLVLDNGENAEIHFIDYVNLTQILDNSNFVDLDLYINISFNFIEIDNIPSLNKSAKIIFYNLTFLTPEIFKNGEKCNKCIIESYNKGTLVFTVPGFSEYTARESSNNTSKGINGRNSGGSSGSDNVSSGGNRGASRNINSSFNIGSNNNNSTDKDLLTVFNDKEIINKSNKINNNIEIKEIIYEKNKLKFSYIFESENLVNENISMEIWLENDYGKEILRYIDNFIADEKIIERELIIDLHKDLVGIYSLYIANINELNKFVKQNLVIGDSKSIGFLIFENGNVKIIVYFIFVILIILAVIFIINYYKSIRKLMNFNE